MVYGQRLGIFPSQEFDIYLNLPLLRLLMHFYCKEVSKDEFLKIEQVILLKLEIENRANDINIENRTGGIVSI